MFANQKKLIGSSKLWVSFALLGLCSCSPEPRTLTLDAAQAYLTTVQSPVSIAGENTYSLPAEDEGLFLKYAPEFVIEDNNIICNKIGEPHLRRLDQKKLQAYVDPSQPKIYVQKTQFSTDKGSYTNLIYRVHFQEIPFGLLPFNIGMGKNMGLFVIVTLNAQNQPVLISTVHTCGCYLAIIPTNFLPKDTFPSDWTDAPVYRYGEKHPAILNYPEPFSDAYHPVFYLRSPTHRISDVFIEKASGLKDRYQDNQMPLTSIKQLDHLKIDGETGECSFFYDGLNKGFVRSDYKPFEFLILGLIAMDINVGVDKRYAPKSELRTRFYTSLNPINRKSSDMGDFANFLKFWGWGL